MSNAITSASSPPVPAPAAGLQNVPGARAANQAAPVSGLPATVKDAVLRPAGSYANPQQMRKELDEALERLNEQVRKNNYNLNFSVDDTTNFVVVKVKDATSGDVIRQIPSETVLRVAHNLEAVKGLLRDEQA